MKRILTLLVFCTLLVSCSGYAVSEDNTGTLITPSDIEVIKQEQKEKEIIYRVGIDNSLHTFYWIENGSVFHTDKSCPSLENSSTLIFGNINHAYNDGVERACSICCGK